GLSWSVDVPADAIQALGNGDLTVNASVTNQNGNTGSGTRDITIDANLPGLRVDTVAGDDVVNIIEHGQALVVTGSSLGLAEGTPLTVTINDVEYTTAVQADGSWSVGITAAQVSAWPAGAVNIAVSGESSAGNPISITHPVTVDLTPAAITINTIATDDVINAAEKGANLTLSGTTTNVEAGQTVTVTFGGKNYTASVAGDGSWTATVPAADLAALPEGSASAQASVSNINGNSASAVHSYSVDSSAPTIIINTVASDNIVNASEADAGVTVSGSTTAEAGQIVTVTLNSPTVQTYQATVQADGSWSINIPAADLAALTDGSHTLTATVNDKAGNPASTTHNLAVDLTVPVLTINTIAGDDIINATEHGQALVISGSSTGGEAGDVVSVTLNNKTYTTTLDASGNWSVGVPAVDVTALGSGSQTVTATVTDAAGNSDNETHTVTVNLTAPTIGINTIATDDVINATEKGADLQISGTSNQPANTAITVTLNGQNYTATTDAAGNWSTTVPASAVGALGEASYTVTANVTDSAGNSNSASHNVQVNTALPGVTINPVATDDIINAAESGVAQTISGQVTGAVAGDTVTVTLGGKTYTATVQGNLSWSVDVPAADIQAIGNGDLTVNASVTNGIGNTGSGSRDITIDANLPGLRVDTVAGDDVVNSIEHGQALVITGSSSGLAAGAALTVVINNVTYGATVLADGTWSLGVPAADVGNWPAGTVNITVSGTNTAGTTSTITHPVTVDLAAVAISINTVSGDDVINAAEKGADLTLSGSTSGVEPGQTVTVTFGGKTYTATVAGDGSWTTTVPAADLSALRDGDATVQASVSNINGNTASATHAYSVDATAPTLAINTIATDDILNAAEAGNPLTISGSSTAEAGQTVTVTLNGVTYTGTVQADGSWSVSVPTTDLSNLTASQYTVSASVSDKAGNPASANHGLAVDLTVPVLTINTVSGDDIINAAEHGQALVISGSSTGGEAGDVITVTLNSKTYTTTLDASGNWSVGVPPSDVTALGSGPQTITAAITDAAGNSDDASRTVTVNLTAPTIGINTIASDDVINATEKGADLQITGTSDQPAGTTITVTLNGQNYTATTDSSGNWGATVPASAVSALGEANYTVTANVTDTAGNSNSASHNVLVNSALPAVTINAVATDDIINAAESGNAQTISGQVTGAAQGDTVIVTLGGNTYTATVQSNLSWSVDVPAADIQALGNGDLTVNASVTNGVGNTGSGSRDITIDANLPGLRVDTVAGDDVINSIEHTQALVITGSSSGLTAGTALTVVINNVTYAATVLADGTWNLGVPAADVSNWPAGTVDITVSGTNSAGTTSTITHPVTVDLAAVAITINTLSGDDVINAVEKGETLVVSGSTSGVEAGQTVTVTFGGKNYTTTVEANGSWTVNVPPADLAALPDGAGNVQASVSNINGNNAQADRAYSVDATAPLVTINTIASDDILNVSEAGAGITISGTTTAQAGQTLTVTLNNNTYQTTVQADGTWSVNVPAADLSGLTASSYTVTATVSDKAGNQASADHALAVDITAPDLTINTVAGDDIINAIEHGQALVVDLAGNVGATGSQSAQIDTVNPAQVLTIASISTDTGSSATDFITSDTTLTLTGSLGAGLASGEVAQISLDSGATWITLTTNGTQWTYTDSRTLTDGSYVYQVRVLDLAGNTGPVVSKTVVVDTINPTATPTIVSYTDDVGQRQGTLSSSQATDDTMPLLNGVLSAPLASGEVVYLYRNGLLLGAVTMVGALNWTYSDSGLVSGAYTYSARVVDLAGNITSSSDFVLTVDTSIPTTLAQITSQTTRDTTPIISGVITAALASGQYVEVVINGKTYTSEPGGAVVVDPAHNTWYVQLPDTDALTVSATAYTVTAQVKSSAGNGNNANISNGTVTVNAAIDYTPTWTTASKTTAWGLTYGLDSHGMWTVLANQQVMQSTDPLTWSKTALTLYQSGNNYATSSIADYDRNGTGDLFITRDDYGTGYINGFTNNGDGTFSSAIQVTVGTLTWYGSIVAFDKEGDGYLDFWIGDAGGPDSNTFLWNNAGTLVGNSTTSNSGGSATVGGAVTGYLSLNEGSGVDLNNDGRIDLVQHTYNLNNYYTLSSLINQGNGTFVWGQNTTNTFLSGAGSGAMSSSVSMTWADFDGDGDMDLFLPASQGRANYGSLLFNTNGVLGSPVAVGATATTYASQFSLAVDWNHDGLMDIARIAQTGQSYLYTNVGGASNWTQSALGGSQSGTTSGVAAMDYDWDGAVDVLVTKQSGSVFLIRNTNTVSYGTSLHLRITDPNGINVYYGNTVKLYNSAGVLVATQIINPQSGMGVNDTSALVNFYGLNAGETYNAVLIKSTGTTASNIDQTVNTSWGGLQATDATHAYDLSAEAGTASNNGKFVGTGYNDTFFATAGTDTYDGSGGWVYSSGTGTWLANGGMDVVDFRLSTVGVTANLSSTAAQATGFNTSTFTNIEGISGSNFNDTLTGSSGDNQLEGRGGNDTLNIGNGGHDTLLYKLLNASDATGGNGSDVVNGFTVGTWEGTADTDRIDIRELLQGSGYTGNGKASYVNGVATLDAQAGNIGDFVKVTQSGSDTIVQIDRDGTGGTFATTNVVTLTGVHTDLATLLANHQLMVV
ncbi:TPA: Ig-like domain-containing protein, partial [Escherichia coli]|nr:Ig-like domain-containing protein [Escherichia coli]